MLDLTPWALVSLTLLGSILAGLVLVPLSGHLGRKLGAVDYPRGPTNMDKPVPRIGGLAIYASTLLILALAWLLSPTARNLFDPLQGKLIGMGLGATMALALGMVDDIRGLRARWKLLAQIITALFIYYWGLRVEVVTNPFSPDAPFLLGTLEMPLNVLWVLVAMNAMNIIDGIDGLAGGLFVLAMILLLAAGLLIGDMGLSVIVAVLLGSTLAFLRYNINGAIFMGDSGSLLLGYLLAAFVPLISPKSAGMAAAVIPIAVLSLPIAEVALTTLRRVWKGFPLGQPDHGHAHHRMLANGMQKRAVVFFIQGLSFLCGLIVLLMTFTFNRSLAYLMGSLWLALVGLFLKMGYTGKKDQGAKGEIGYASIFLDRDRTLHRNIFKLKLSASRQEIETRFREMGEALGLVQMCYRVQRGGRVLEFRWPSDAPTREDQGEHLLVTIKDSGGQTPPWEITAAMPSKSLDQSWPRLLNWLRGMAYSLAQAVDRLEQEGRLPADPAWEGRELEGVRGASSG